ncbi:helix-turn-helix domain-containing protein [Paenibacillus sp. S150]|uniref:helix-turn-helix domain-containing protein n=1 Tax=Paenibacillus sp. S150 TaxID=2749826 RepID=UPI001C5A132A|nr:helix-turn-helix domain-containing protein [Paenibacillus sp. S150]MBW4084451.1 helix-turn-helix domain-containing protein [Paenibacillus sp. S150]
MSEIINLIRSAQNGNRDAEAELVARYEPLINKYSRKNGLLDEDCKQHLTIEFILAVRRFDLKRYH